MAKSAISAVRISASPEHHLHPQKGEVSMFYVDYFQESFLSTYRVALQLMYVRCEELMK